MGFGRVRGESPLLGPQTPVGGAHHLHGDHHNHGPHLSKYLTCPIQQYVSVLIHITVALALAIAFAL